MNLVTKVKGDKVRFMSKDGVIRRIDDLGCIQIPKEVREQLHFNEADKMIWSIDGDTLKLSKFYLLDQIKDAAKESAYLIGAKLHVPVLICNTEKVIAVSGLDPYISGKYINRKIVESKNLYDWTKSDEKIQLVPTYDMFARFIQPIIYNDDIIGAIAVIAPKNFIEGTEEFSSENAINLLKLCANHLSNELKEEIR